MLPGIDGFEVCRRIRARHDVPIVMLTARGEDTDRVVGLELGADDYVPKPFNPRELLARMRAVLAARPARSLRTARAGDRVEVGDLVVDVPAHKATLGGKELQLTSFEFRVLVALARRAGETVTREELAGASSPRAGTTTRASTARSTCTSRTCGQSSATRRASQGASARCAASATSSCEPPA